ncbi:MAG: hypothetical protein Q8K82_12150 [Gemmatimonadaceae bacterium]|nr:hypothetical protein [Gemmatimonadaceae bacterium]
MRASPYNEHKLVLQEFFLTAGGKLLLQRASDATGETTERIMALAKQLPQLDFYVVSAEDRVSWTGTPNVTVVPVLNPMERATGYRPNGSHADITRTDRDLGQVLIALHPAEPKYRRLNPQPDRPGMTIQDVNDGDVAGSVRIGAASGIPVEYDLADLTPERLRRLLASAGDVRQQQCLVECEGDGGGGGGGAPGRTYLNFLQIANVCDNVPICDANEFEFRTHYFVNGVRIKRIDTRRVGIPRWFNSAVAGPVPFAQLMDVRVTNGSQSIIVDVVETDASSGDDFFTPSPTLVLGASAFQQAGNISCIPAPPFGVGMGPCGYPVIWREVNMSFSATN